jgi:hypothetical protein
LSAAERIRRHAGLDRPGDETAVTVSAAASVSGGPAEIEAATADFVDALDSFNRQLNGEFPAAMSSGESGVVPRDVAYAVAEVVRMLRAFGADHSAWVVETAWLAVLAGDVDDVGEHIALEEAARRE